MKIYQDTIIILHGWQSSKEKWNRVKEEIEKEGIEVIIPDLPGFKKENQLDQAWNLSDYINWCRKFSKNKENFFLLGHSFGGRIAIKWTAQNPEKIKGLILVGAAGIRHKKSSLFSVFIPILKKLSFLPGYKFLRNFFYKYILRKTDYLKVRGVMQETFKKIIKEDLTPYLSQIKTSTLIVWGKRDKTTPLSDGELMKKEIENSELEILEAGHSLYLEKPEILAEKIITFIKKYD